MPTIEGLVSGVEGVRPFGEAACIRCGEDGSIRHMSFPVDGEIPALPADARMLAVAFALDEPVASVLADGNPVECAYICVQFPIGRHRIGKPTRTALAYMAEPGWLQELPTSCPNAVWGTPFCFEHPVTLEEYLPCDEVIREAERQCGVCYDALREQDRITRDIYSALRSFRF